MRALAAVLSGVAVACGSARPFPLRRPFLVDTDLQPVSVPCRPDPKPDDPARRTCAPREYVSPFVWDQLDNLVFARLSRAFSVAVSGEAVNVNSLDEVPDSSWFTNRPRAALAGIEAAGRRAPGACNPADLLSTEDQVADGAWRIDHGKDNGSTLGFRVEVPGQGRYMLKADDKGQPERASAASVIGAAFYDALGFNTSCEQIVVLRKAQLQLTPGLLVVDNDGVSHPFDEAALDKVLATTTQLPGGRVRMQASKWLRGVTLGPFRYTGTRDDDPNDVVDHADRRELRGSRILAAWLDHWDAREQNSMDVWRAVDPSNDRASPGHVVHYLIDLSDTLGGEVSVAEMSRRLGHSYDFDLADIVHSLVTLGADERPWDHARPMIGREKFNFFRISDFDPALWKPAYPNPAFLRMTERDAAWMARLIARFSIPDLRRFVEYGQWSDPGDAAYLTSVLAARQRRILMRYLGRLSPLGEVRAPGPDQICATDFARLRELAPPEAFRYTVVERRGGARIALRAEPGEDGAVCFRGVPVVTGQLADDDPARIVTFEVENGTRAGPLVIHAYDLGERGMRVVGLTRPEP
ncbi:MAG TPA: hypothetical protein VFK02_28135 [Kofleriaceae bacterium]|nr:hypothetical protein [Kofleriaceae bacterium]